MHPPLLHRHAIRVTPRKGYAVGLPLNFQSRERNEDFISKRNARLNALSRGTTDLATVDWSPIRDRDPEKFYEFWTKYKSELMPDVKNHGAPSVFEKKFAEELREALDQPPRRNGHNGRDRFHIYVSQFLYRTIGDYVHAIEEEGIYIEPSHPYMELVANRGWFMEKEEKAQFLELVIDSKYRHNPKSDTPNENIGIGIEKNIRFFRNSLRFDSPFGYTAPKTANELFALLSSLEKIEYRYYEVLDGRYWIKDLAQYEALLFLKTHPNAKLSAAQLGSLYDLGKDQHGLLKKPFEAVLSDYAERHYQEDLKLDVPALIQVYKIHQRSDFFKQRVDLREAYERAIMERVEQEKLTPKKQQLIEALLLTPPDEKTYHRYFSNKDSKESPGHKFLNNPEFRKWAIDSWVKHSAINIAKLAKAEGLTDNSTPGYLSQAKWTVDKVVTQADGITRNAMLTQWLDHIEAQEKLSFYVRDKLNDVAAGEIAKLHYHASAGEAFLDHLAFDSRARKATIEFLRAPATEESAREYAIMLRESAKNTANYAYSSEFPGLKDKLEAALTKSDLYDEDNRLSTHAAEMLHRNFTNSPMEYRTFLMEKILFPPNANTKPMHGTTPEKFVFDATLPESEPYAKYGRSLLKNYLDSLRPEEDYVKRMYLSAMLVAEDPSAKETDPQKRVGKAIHSLLGNMDNPLAGKLSQAIDSSNVPDWLRNPASKISTNIPPRWVVWEMFNQNAPKEVKATTTHLGKTRAGAIGIAVELEKDAGTMPGHGYAEGHQKTVFKMERRGAGAKVELHAPRVTHMIEESVKEFPELASAKPILDHAVRAGRIETKFSNAPLQTEIAKRMTDGLEITIGGEAFTFHEVPILKANSSSHEMAYANGTVFNELPKEQKAKVAHALFTLENYLPLQGLETDWDRHGAQVIVEGNHIYLLDRGGMALEPPTKKEKQLLGRTIATAFNEHIVRDMPFHEAISKAVDASADDKGNLNHYVATIARAQHNLGDIRRELSPEQQMESLMAVFATGRVDKVIQESAMEALALPAKTWLMEKMMDDSPKPKTIEIHDPNIEKRKQPIDTPALIMSERKDHSQPWQNLASVKKRPDSSTGPTDHVARKLKTHNAEAGWVTRNKPSPDIEQPQRQPL